LLSHGSNYNYNYNNIHRKRKRSTATSGSTGSEYRIKRNHCLRRQQQQQQQQQQRCLVFLLFVLLAKVTSASLAVTLSDNTQTHHNHYNTKNVKPYLYNILKKSHKYSDAANSRNLQKNNDSKDKEDDKNKVPTTPPPTPSPSRRPTSVPTASPSKSPTLSPTASPTRAPVVVPWMNLTTGNNIELKVSIFMYESREENVTVVEPSNRRRRRRTLSRLSAAEILDNSQNELIEAVLSSMATILCDNEEGIHILNVVNASFYDYCGMIVGEQNITNSVTNFDDDDDDGTVGDDQGTLLNPSSVEGFEVKTTSLPLDQTYLVTDLIDEETGLLNVEDRRVFLSNLNANANNGGDSGGYLYWTVWSVSYPILQLRTVVDESQETTVTNSTMDQVQATFDRLFSTAVTNGVMDELLQKKSKDNVLVASLEGLEVETFVSAMERFETTVPSNNNKGEEQVILQGRIYVFWQPIRIAGFVILGVLFLIVGLLMKVGHERYKYDAWDTGLINDKKQNHQQEQYLLEHNHDQPRQGMNVDISTSEGLDYMLQCSHEARKQSNVIISPSENSDNALLSDGVIPMDMGNTLSEIAGAPVKSDVVAGIKVDASTPQPSPRRVMRSSLLRSLVGLDRYKEYDDAECVGNNDNYALVSVKSKANRSSFVESTTQPVKPLLPPSINSVSSDSSDDGLLFNQKSETAALKDAFRGGNSPNHSIPFVSTPKRKRFGKNLYVATPEHAERVRSSDSDEYAFVSVSTKNHKYK